MEENNQNQNPASTVSPDQIPPVFRPKSKPPILIIGIILFLLIAGSAAGVYILKQQSLKTAAKPIASVLPNPLSTEASVKVDDTTTNWKTYSNSQFNYSVQYPSELYTNCGRGSFLLYNGKEGTRECALGEETSEFLIINQLSGTANFQTSEYPACYKVNKENILIDGVSGIKYTNTILNDKVKCNTMAVLGIRNEVHIELTKDTTPYIIVYYENENKAIKEKVLSTFKFTDSNVTPAPDPTVSWDTFSNNYFSLKYPKTFNNWQKMCDKSNSNGLSLFKSEEKEPCVVLNPPIIFSIAVPDPKDTTGLNPIPTAECANTKKETIIIDLITADKYISTIKKPLADGCFWKSSVIIKIKKNNLLYNLSYYPDYIDESIANQIISTFKFTQ